MLKIDYRNPMTKIFQYEYALYLLMSELFHDVHCSSVFALETLKLYYMDLVSTSKSGYASYEKQYVIEEKIRCWIKRDVIGSVRFPLMDRCKVEITMKQNTDFSHIFIFSDGIFAFSVRLNLDKKKRIIGIKVRNHTPINQQNNQSVLLN